MGTKQINKTTNRKGYQVKVTFPRELEF